MNSTPSTAVAVRDTTQAGQASPTITQPGKPTSFSSIFTPPDRQSALQMCEMLSRETWVGASFRGNPMFVAIALAFGERFNLSPISSLTNIAVINGKPALFGDIVKAACEAADPDMQYTEDYEYSGSGDKKVCVACTVTVTRGGKETHSETFTKADAERAGLWNKNGPWKTYPHRMLMARARGFALRTVYPDVLAGCITSEEADDYPTQSERQQMARPNGKQRPIKPHPATVVDADTSPATPSTEDEGELLCQFRDTIAQADSLRALEAAGEKMRELPASVRNSLQQSYVAKRRELWPKEGATRGAGGSKTDAMKAEMASRLGPVDEADGSDHHMREPGQDG